MENLPLPINSSITSNGTFAEPMPLLAQTNTGDEKAIGIYSKYVSGGTKYAVCFREPTTGRYKYGYTLTQPTDTVTDLILGDIEVTLFYSDYMSISSLTQSAIIGSDSKKNVVSLNLPSYPSMGTVYVNAYARITFGDFGWRNFGTVWAAGYCTSDFSANTATPGSGMKYTGLPALAKISFNCSVVSLSSYYALAIGQNTPTPLLAPGAYAPNYTHVIASSTDGLETGATLIAQLNTGDSLILYSMFDNIIPNTVDIISGSITATIIEYLS